MGASRLRGLGRVLSAAVVVVVAVGGVSACSSGDGEAGATASASETQGSGGATGGASTSGGATAEATAGGSAPASVSPESLSDPAIQYTVGSIPEGLDQTQTEVLLAFVDYDRETWEALRTMGATAEVEAVTTGDELTVFWDVYNGRAARQEHVEGSVTTEVSSVNVNPDGMAATVVACVDQTQMAIRSSSGEDRTTEDILHRFSFVASLVPSGNGWMVSSNVQTGVDEC